jgi:NADH-quinone oxidoreductase subunit M
MQLVEKVPWIKSIGVQYFLGIDGISLPMVILTTLLAFLAVIASWNINLRPKEYFVLMLLLETGMLGVFLALDFVLFYVFWEVVLVPMYFLIGIWGGPRREYAAIKFFIYTLLGSVVMLIGILALYFASGLNTFSMLALIQGEYSRTVQDLVFLAFFIGFAVKVPLFPFHTWLPDAHVEAPTAVSVLLAGVLLKMGSYGFLRISLPILPQAFHRMAFAIAILAVINIVYGAFVAMTQRDLKKLVAYSSVSHMGYVMLGVAAATTTAVNGAVLQMFNHGTITGMLFLLVGLIYERTHTREIGELGGLMGKVPILAGILSFAAFASLGLPGLSGFVGEFLVLLGSFSKYTGATILAAAGIVITAGYLLWMVQRVNLGTLKSRYADLTDVTLRDLSTLVPLVLIIIFIGVYPSPVLNIINPAVTSLINIIGGA